MENLEIAVPIFVMDEAAGIMGIYGEPKLKASANQDITVKDYSIGSPNPLTEVAQKFHLLDYDRSDYGGIL